MATTKNDQKTEAVTVNDNTSKNMNNIIDFQSVCGEGEIDQIAIVDQQAIDDMFNAFINLPSSVCVKFKNVRGYLYMIVKMSHRDKFFSDFETYADAKLVEKILCSMTKPNMVGCLEGYKSTEHQLVASDKDPRIDLFHQFVMSPYTCHFDKDFTSNKGEKYICATFKVGYRKEIRFCLKRTKEIDRIIQEAILAA